MFINIVFSLALINSANANYAPAIEERYQVLFSVLNSPVVGEVCTLSLSVQTVVNSPQTEVSIFLPHGVHLISGDTFWSGNITEGNYIVLHPVITISDSGKYNIFARITTKESDLKYENLKIADLYIISWFDSATVDTLPPPGYYIESGIEISDTTEINNLGGDVNVTGVIKYLDKVINDSVPLPGVKVVVFDLGRTLRALTYCNEQGMYNITGLYSGIIYDIYITTENKAAWLPNNHRTFYIYKRVFFSQSGTYTINIPADPPEWARILENMYYARKFCEERLRWVKSRAVETNYPADRTYFQYVWPNFEWIKIGRNHVWGNWMGRFSMAHEYGHSVMYERYGWWLPQGWGPIHHYIHSKASPEFAFSEGWADFFAHAVFEHIRMLMQIGLKKGVENYFYDSVRPLWQDGPPYECQHGDSVEGAVMQVLWDLYDDSNTNDDSPGKDDEGCDSWVDKIWATISRQRSNNIAEFRQLWNGSNFPNYTEMNNCNLYGTKPPAPSNLLASDITHNSVRLNWNDNAQNEGQYLIYRYREGSPNWEVIVRPPNTSSYTDATLDPVTGYNYKVRALTCDSSNFSNEIYIKTKYLPVTNLQARHLQDRVELSWNNPEPGFVGTLIVRKEGSPIGWNPTDGQGYNIGEVVAPGVIVIYNGNGEQFVDNLSNPNPCYYYKAFAYTAHNGVSLFSLGVEACATLPFSEFVPITGYNNAPKVISRGRNIYLTYFSGTDEFQGRYRVIYQYSSDGGNTWQSEYAADFANNCLSPISPAISLDGQGNPYIVWVNWWRQDKGPPQPALEWRLGYTRKIENNWENVRWLMIEGVGQNVPVPQEHFPVSFVVARESGYVAVKYDYENRKEIRTIAFSLGGNNCWNCILPQSANFSSDPSINIDAGGRISVVFTKGSDRRIYIYFKNDRYNDNWNIQQTNFYGYHPTSFINGDTLLISWYNESDNWIKLARFLKSQNGYTLLAIENVTQPDWFLTYPSPKIIRGDLILCENSYNNGISYSLKRGNAWNTVIIDNSGSTNFLYPQACIVPVIRNGKMLLNQGLQVFWTLKENEIYYLRNRLAILPISPNYANYSKITFSNQGELLTIEPGTENSHMVYDAGGRIVYAKSLDKGESWETGLEVDSGSYPSLCLDNSGMPRISYLKNDTVFCKTLKSDNTWHKTILFGGNGNLKPNQAVIAQTYPKDLSRYSYCAFLVKNLSEGNSKLYLSIFNVEEDIGPEPEEVADGISLKSPSIAITPGDIIHLVWEEGGEIYYRFGEKDSTGELIWSEIYNISESPEVISENPVIEAYGELVIACWKEGEPGEIYRRVRNLAEPPLPTWPPGWSGIENLSQSPDKESNYPVISTPDVCAWNEKVDSLNYEVIAWVKGSLVNLSESENSSKYPHISVEPPTISDDGTVSPDVIINAIWTEEIIPDTLYEVRFKRYTYTSSSIAKTPYLAPVIGETIPSTYCESRDGVINYGDFSCDYSSSSLIYNLPYLNPRASYLLRAVVYKETPRVWREEVYVDSQFITEVFYYPYIPETLNIILPKESYENDLAIKKEIERLIGSYALIADLKVYEVSLPESLQGGGQSLRGGKILRPVLYQNRPNPFKGLTKISFSIPKETYVSLLIYDLSGRKVRTIVNERMKPGYYNLKWDGKDDKGKDLPQGVYFYRLKVKGFEDIKKTVLLR